MSVLAGSFDWPVVKDNHGFNLTKISSVLLSTNTIVKDVAISAWFFSRSGTVLRAVSGNSGDGACFKLDKQTWWRKRNDTQKTISQNLLIKIL